MACPIPKTGWAGKKKIRGGGWKMMLFQIFFFQPS
jgi:hypothetical protein